MSRVLEATVPALALDRDGLALSQTPLAAGDLTLTAATTFAAPHTVSIYGAASEVAQTFTVYGTDRNGTVISEAITGPGAGATVTGNLLFKTVTRIAVSAATAGAVEAGWIATGYSRWLFAANDMGHYSHLLRLIIATSATYDLQATSMAMNRDPNYVGGEHPDDIITLVSGGSTSQDVPLLVPYIAYRLKVTAQVGTMKLRMIKSRTG